MIGRDIREPLKEIFLKLVKKNIKVEKITNLGIKKYKRKTQKKKEKEKNPISSGKID